jgi:deazaflavin-dependent oxidoreductase (nitroreductase family)
MTPTICRRQAPAAASGRSLVGSVDLEAALIGASATYPVSPVWHHPEVLDRGHPWVRRLFKAPIRLYHWRLGRLLGHRFLLLEHHGRRSGTQYETVLEVIKWDSREAVVVSGWGPVSDWYRNVTAGGDVRITIGGQSFPASHRLIPLVEAAQVLADYEHRNRFVRPVINSMLGALVGWPYDGSGAARRRLVRQLPMVAFQPSR